MVRAWRVACCLLLACGGGDGVSADGGTVDAALFDGAPGADATDTDGTPGAPDAMPTTIVTRAAYVTATDEVYTVVRQQGGLVDHVVRNGMGEVQVWFNDGAFQQPPSCVFAPASAQRVAKVPFPTSTMTANALFVDAFSLAAADSSFFVICTGSASLPTATTTVRAARIGFGGLGYEVTNELGDWVDSITSVSPGLVSVGFKAGVFTEAPSCAVTARVPGPLYTRMMTAATFATMVFEEATPAGSSGAAQDTTFGIVCVASAATNEPMVGAHIDENGGTYSIGHQYGAWLDGVTRTEVGTAELDLNTAAFTTQPVCVAVAEDASTYATIDDVALPSAIRLELRATFDVTADDGGFYVLCAR